MNNAEKNTALFGGKIFSVILEDGNRADIKVRQLRMSDYEHAFKLIDDEIAITAFCCSPAEEQKGVGKVAFNREWAMTLHPESYEGLQEAVREVNAKGFFSYAARRLEKLSKENRDMLTAMAELPPETLKVAMELGKSASPTSSPRPRPIPS